MGKEGLEVVDKVTEVNVKLSNILTALVLMVMSWVGFNINALKDHMAEALLQIAVIQRANEHQDEDIKKLEMWRESHIELHEKELK